MHNFQIQNIIHSLAKTQKSKPKRQDGKSKHHVQKKTNITLKKLQINKTLCVLEFHTSLDSIAYIKYLKLCSR